MQLDNIDKGILDELQLNARITNSDLAKLINLSPSSTLERVKKLEASGLIQKYVTLLNTQKANFYKSISIIDEVLECYHITGNGDFLLKIATRDIAHYDKLVLHSLSALSNVQNLKTSVVLSTFKYKTNLSV